MPFHQIQTEMLRFICEQFLTFKKPTTRRELNMKFKRPDLLNQLVHSNATLFEQRRDHQEYFPTIATFVQSGSDELLKTAKLAALHVFPVLQNLYEIDTYRNVSYAQFLEHAQKMYDHVDESMLNLGLYLAPFLTWITSHSRNDAQTDVTMLTVAEDVIAIDNPELYFESQVTRHRQYSVLPDRQTPAVVQPAMLPQRIRQGSGFDWWLVHPVIRDAAHVHFDIGHYRIGVFNALTELAHRLKTKAHKPRLEGSSLAQEAFKPEGGVLRFKDPNIQSADSKQVGYMQLFQGAFTGIRNPNAHDTTELPPERAIHFIYVASLLMYLLDEATVEPQQPQKQPTE